MRKEICIIILVIIIVVGLDYISNRYTANTVFIMCEKLDKLKEDVIKEDSIKTKEKIQEINNIWKEKTNVMAYYIEHDELEKVGTQLTMVNANLEVEEFKQCVEYIDTTKYILNHIRDKEKMDLKSVF